jgi:hypothetical protein
MKGIGITCLAIGIFLGGYSLKMDTTVDSSSLYGLGERVNNMGLMNDKTNNINLSGFICIIGVILLVADEIKEANDKLIKMQIDCNLTQIKLMQKMLTNQDAALEKNGDSTKIENQ